MIRREAEIGSDIPPVTHARDLRSGRSNNFIG